MNYTNSIGQQQLPGIEEAAASSSVNRTAKAASVAAQNEPAVSLDETTLSSAANLVGQALSGSDVRTEKVATLQQSIAAGTYNVPSSEVAASIVRSLLS